MATRLQSVWLRAIVITIAALAIAPSTFALISLPASGAGTCGMACCRRMKSCCCRGARQHLPESPAAKWRAVPGCAEGCRQRATVPRIVGGMVEAPRPGIGTPAVHAAQLPTRQAQAVSPRADFAQFERPPPPSC